MQQASDARSPVAAGCERVNPQELDLDRILEIMDRIKPRIEKILPRKRSGYPYVVFVVLQACIQLAGGSVNATIARLESLCKSRNEPFQSFRTAVFSNRKQRRYFPDQPSLSRCLRTLAKFGLIEKFWNEVNFAHLLLLKDLGIVGTDINLIADYKETRCPKDKADPFCFGTKEGKTVHKTLCFSVISKGLHQVVFAFKIAKRQHKLPIFSEVIRRFEDAGFFMKNAMLDRGFYRKELLVAFKKWRISVVMPGRQCAETRTMITDYLNGKGKRHGKGHMKLHYVKKIGNVYLTFDLVLCAKRSYKLNTIKTAYHDGRLSLSEAAKRIFPLIFLKANNKGVTKIVGNESRIRKIYRARWNIEIAFREMNRLGLAPRCGHRDGRLAAFGARMLVYNMWQVERYLLLKSDPMSAPPELNEFLGRGCIARKIKYIEGSIIA